MSIRITRPRFKRSLNDARCELAEARSRAARSLAKLHEKDGNWLGWLSAEHYKVAQAKWSEYLKVNGEERKVARYEFLINLKSWLELLPLPLAEEGDSYRKGNLYIAGFFGEDAFVISHARTGKRYRLLCDSLRLRRNDPYLRYPGSERFILPDGEDVGIMETTNATRDRLVCLHDAFVLLAITRGKSFSFRFVGANDKYPIYPKALEKDLSSFVGMPELIERIKREVKVYGTGKEEAERVDAALCGPPSTDLYKPKKARETVSLSDVNQSILDSVDPLSAAPSLGSKDSEVIIQDTVAVTPGKKRRSERETSKVFPAETPMLDRPSTTSKQLQQEAKKGDSASRSRHGTKRITSRKVITNAILREDLEAREAAALAAPQKKKKGLTAFFEGILDDVDPLAVRPSLRKKQTGKTAEMRESDLLASEFMEAEEIQNGHSEGPDQIPTNRIISNFSRKVSTARSGSKQTRRPSGDVTTALVRKKVGKRNDHERRSAIIKLQEDLDIFFDPRDTNDASINTTLRMRRTKSEILHMNAFQAE